jgi:hypothetical protein
VTVAEHTTPGLSKSAGETVLELQEGARVRLKRPFPLLLTWQKKETILPVPPSER